MLQDNEKQHNQELHGPYAPNIVVLPLGGGRRGRGIIPTTAPPPSGKNEKIVFIGWMASSFDTRKQ